MNTDVLETIFWYFPKRENRSWKGLNRASGKVVTSGVFWWYDSANYWYWCALNFYEQIFWLTLWFRLEEMLLSMFGTHRHWNVYHCSKASIKEECVH